jgi:uncharacterized protein
MDGSLKTTSGSSAMISSELRRPLSRAAAWLPVLLLLAIAIGGLLHVKWAPYYAKSFFAAAHHTLGPSILSGSAAAPRPVGWQAGLAYSLAYLQAIWQALVLGLALGAGVEVFLPRRWLVRLFGGTAAPVCATALALPSMMCTCCAAPVAVGLIESETSPAAALTYWLANPVLNPATLVFIGFVLGWQWTALRLGVGLPLVFGLGSVAARLLPPGSRLVRSPAPPAETNRNFLLAWIRTFLRIAVRLVPEYLVLVFALGALRAWLFPEITPAIGHASWLTPVLAAAGTLFVIPTAGEVPIIQVLQHFGLAGGGAAALLITLPAVSLPSLAMLGRVLPLRSLLVLGLGTFLFGLLAAVVAAASGL